MTVWINELHYDNASVDTGEFIEIAGVAGTDLTGWTVVLYNGTSSQRAPYNTIELSGVIADQTSGFGFKVITLPSNGIQNGAPDGLALVDNNGAVVEFLSYEGSFTAASGPAAGLTSTDIGVAESGSTPVGSSLQLTGIGSSAADFTWATQSAETPDAANNGQTFASTGPVADFTLELLHIADQEASTSAIIDAPNLSAVLNALKAEDLGGDGVVDNTLVLSSGDAIIPGVFFDASEASFGSAGVADIQIQNELGIQAIALGNHEFDFGTATLAGLIDGSAAGSIFGSDFAGAQFPYLSSNLDFSTDPFMAPLEVAGGQAPQSNTVSSSTIIETNGEQIAVIGATTPTLAAISSPGAVGVSPTWASGNPTEAELDALAAEIQAEVDAVLAANNGLNKVILLAHMQQITIEQALAARLENVDVIVAGGSNTLLTDADDRLRDGDVSQGDYPQFITNAGGTTTALVNTDGSYKYVGRLVIDFDADGNIIQDSYYAAVSGAYATDAQGVADLNAANLVDPEIQQIVDAIEAEIIAAEGNVFGVSDVFLNGNRSGGATDGVRTQETNLGNLTADANLAEAQKSDGDVVISLKNGGGIRASVGETVVLPGDVEATRLPNGELIDSDGNIIKPAGGISQNDIQTTLAFNNDLVVLTLTVDEIVALLEHGVGAIPGVSGRFPQIAGLKFSYDPDLPAGDRVASAAIVDENGEATITLVRNGEVVDGDATYKVVTLGFLAAPRFDENGVFTGGGDGYPFPNTNTDPSVGEVGPDAARVNITFLEQEGVQTGAATFADDGTEQDALAEYLNANFNPANGGAAFDQADVAEGADERIQNLNERDDTVLPGIEAPEGAEVLIATVTDQLELEDGAEIVDFDPATKRAFVTSGDGLQVVDASNVEDLKFETTLDPKAFGLADSEVTSVSVKNGLVAIAVPTVNPDNGDDKTANGAVLFFNAATLAFLGSVEVGPLPDMVTFDATGSYLLVANEGESSGEENEPDAAINPNGSVSIIAVDAANPGASTVNTLGFTDLSITFDALADKGVRINRDAPSAAADLEPEFIAIEGAKAFITLQENNAVAVIEDIANPTAFTIDSIQSLGAQNFDEVEFDPSNRDDGINFTTAPVVGLRQADAIATYNSGGKTFYVTANEGDGRDVDESRGNDLVDGDLSNGEVDATAFDDATLAALADNAQLGRLKFSNVDGDTDGDGLIDQLTAFGARSFTIFDEAGNVVFDSADLFEKFTAANFPEIFNSNGEADSFDSRSDDKGPEPEAVTIGQVDGLTYAFVGLERVGGVMVFDITNPENVVFDQYLRTEGDIGPEGLKFIPANDSPTGEALLAIASEESSTLSFVEFDSKTNITLISDIQGETNFTSFFEDTGDYPMVGVDDKSPLLDQIVTIRAIVTADMQDGGAISDLNGFFVMEEAFDQDGDAFTSEGLFIFDGSNPAVDVNVGDLVEITGMVAEFFGETQLRADTVTVVTSGNDAPNAVEIDMDAIGVMLDDDGEYVADFEAYEGMLATIPEALTVSEMFNLDRFGEYRVSADGQPAQFTQNNNPDVDGYDAHLQDVASRSIVFDDGRTIQNPDELEIIDGGDGVLDANDSFRMGDTISNATGVVSYSFDEFRLQDPTGDYSQENPRSESPEQVDGFKVVSFNVLNYFTTLDENGNVTDTGADPRGADSAVELERQATKLVNAIVEMDADVLGLIELENSATDAAVADLVARVNAELGSEVYGFIPTGLAGGDAITNGFIYKIETAAPVGNAAVLTEFNGQNFLNPLGADRDLNRPAIAQTFEDIETGATMTVAVNHLKSKGSLSGVPADEDQLDGQGRNNATRTEAAKILAEWLDSDPTGSGSENVLIIGDLNAYAQEDPLKVLAEAGYVDIAYTAFGEEASSFVFDGQTGTLDYALANSALYEQLAGVTEWKINSPEADAIDYNLDFGRDPELFNGETAARNSDHDPVIVGFNLKPQANSHIEFNFAKQWGNTGPKVLAAELHEGAANAQDDASKDAIANEFFDRYWVADNEWDKLGDSGVDLVNIEGAVFSGDLPDEIDFVTSREARKANKGASLEDGDVIEQDVNVFKVKTRREEVDPNGEGDGPFGVGFAVQADGSGRKGGYGDRESDHEGGKAVEDNELLFIDLNEETLDGTAVSFSVDVVRGPFYEQSRDAETKENLKEKVADVTVDFWIATDEGTFILSESQSLTIAENDIVSVESAELFDAVSFRATEDGADDWFRVESLEISTFLSDDDDTFDGLITA